ncbi:hypothetical protein [Stenotrophomonas tumulicola]|nr:hypothetical protein [Stenotrophomonas tumulicola]
MTRIKPAFLFVCRFTLCFAEELARRRQRKVSRKTLLRRFLHR